MSNLEKTVAKTFLEMAESLKNGSYGVRPKIALTGMGGEAGHGRILYRHIVSRGRHHREGGGRGRGPQENGADFSLPSPRERTAVWGNDVLQGTPDILVTGSLTGNVLIKMLSA